MNKLMVAVIQVVSFIVWTSGSVQAEENAIQTDASVIPVTIEKTSVAIAAPSPKISAFVNGSKDVGVFRGWPLIVKVTIDHPQTAKEGEKIEPITLESEKDWTDLLSVEVINADKKPEPWTFDKSLLTKTGPKTSLDGTNGAFLAFLLSPKASGKLTSGEYELQIVLKGKVEAKSSLIKVKIMDHPEKLTEKGEVARDRLLAMYHALKGDKAEAVKIVERIKYVQVSVQHQGAQQPMTTQAQPMYAMTGPAYIQQPTYQPASNGAAELLSIISAFGFQNEIPTVDSIEAITLAPTAVTSTSADMMTASNNAAQQALAQALNTPVTVPPTLVDPPAVDVVGPATDYLVNHTIQPTGFTGPDMTMKVEWSEPVDVDLWMNYGEGGGIPNTTECKQGPCFEEFRPWDLPLTTRESEFLVSAYLHPINGGANKASVKVSYQRSPGEPWQSETIVLDEEKHQEFWIAFKVDIASGAATLVKRYQSSIDSYLSGDPEEVPPQPEEASTAEQPADQSADQPASNESQEPVDA